MSKRKRGEFSSKVGVSTTAFGRKLIDDFNDRKVRNPRLSMRDFSRLTKVAVSTMALLLKGSTVPSSATVERIGRALNWPDEEIKELNDSLSSRRVRIRSSNDSNAATRVQKSTFENILSLAILTLAEIPDYPLSEELISKNFNISRAVVDSSLRQLVKKKLIEIDGSRIQTGHSLKNASRINSLASLGQLKKLNR